VYLLFEYKNLVMFEMLSGYLEIVLLYVSWQVSIGINICILSVYGNV